MPKHIFALLSQKYSSFPLKRSEMPELNKTFGSHKSFNSGLRNLFISPYVNESGAPQLSNSELIKLDRLKIRQGMSFLDEAENQMEKVYLMLSLIEPSFIDPLIFGNSQKNLLLRNYVKLSLRKLITDSGKALVKKGAVIGGVAVGGLIGPASALIGGYTAGTVGNIGGKRFIKNIELSLSEMRIIDARLKRLYISNHNIDLELTKAYTLSHDLNSQEVRGKFFKSGFSGIKKQLNHIDTYTFGLLDVSIILNQIDVIYQTSKAYNGYSNEKLSKISWLMEDLMRCLACEGESIKSAFLRLYPNQGHLDAQVHLGKMREIDEYLYFGSPKYKTKQERSLKYKDIDKIITKTKSHIAKNRIMINKLRTNVFNRGFLV